MIRFLGTCAALALIVVLAYPFARDAVHRYQVGSRLSAQDKVAFSNWSGDPASFMRSLYERCELINGRNAPACDTYK
jgi:hypothetical protein